MALNLRNYPPVGFPKKKIYVDITFARSFLTAQHMASRSQFVLRIWIRNMKLKSKPKAKQTPVAAFITAPTPKPVARIPLFDAMPDSGYVRESQLVQSPKRPGVPVPLPFSAPTLWRMVKNKNFPAPIKLSERVTAWRVGTVRDWLTAQAAA